MNVTATTTRTSLLVGLAGVLSVAVTFLGFHAGVPGVPFPGPRFTALVGIKLFFSTFTVLLLAVLFVNYAQIYRSMPNPFARSLLVTTVLLGFYALASNPLLPVAFGFPVVDVGPFTYLPDLFASLAVITLLHQSLK